MLKFQMPEIKRIIKDIYIATKVQCVLYDEKFNVIYAYPEKMHPFCYVVRQHSECRKRCLGCDLHGLTCAVKSQKTYIYKCHMGLTEAVSPIIHSGTVIGFIMIGQTMSPENTVEIKSNINCFPDKRLIPSLRKNFGKISVLSNENIYAVTNIAEMCASYLWLKQYISFNGQTLSFAIRDYIDTHLQDDLSVASLCSAFNMSKSSLYLLSKKEFGKGISEYIRDIRIEKAKQLLSAKELTVSEVSEQTGFIDTNYFIKVFRTYTGKTPGKWKSE